MTNGLGTSIGDSCSSAGPTCVESAPGKGGASISGRGGCPGGTSPARRLGGGGGGGGSGVGVGTWGCHGMTASVIVASSSGPAAAPTCVESVPVVAVGSLVGVIGAVDLTPTIGSSSSSSRAPVGVTGATCVDAAGTALGCGGDFGCTGGGALAGGFGMTARWAGRATTTQAGAAQLRDLTFCNF